MSIPKKREKEYVWTRLQLLDLGRSARMRRVEEV